MHGSTPDRDADARFASQGRDRRIVPIGGYILALRWAPEFCQANGSKPDAAFECTSASRFGFTLHGLWPDGVGKAWPQYCRPTTILPPAVIARHLCANPSVQLTQHEWAKHGTCTNDSPEQFLERSRQLYMRIGYPDMNALSRHKGLTVGAFTAAFARANPDMRADMMRVTANRKGWLQEVWLCLDKTYQLRKCPASQGGLKPGVRLKIWRARR